MGVDEHGTRDQMSMPTATTRSREGPNGINVGLASRLQVMTHELRHGLVQPFRPRQEAERLPLSFLSSLAARLN
jgi:hypothetical protein